MPGSKAQGRDEEEMVHPALTRVTVNLVARSIRALDDIQQATGNNRTDVINRAIQLYAILEEEVDRGGRLLVDRGDGLIELKFI